MTIFLKRLLFSTGPPLIIERNLLTCILIMGLKLMQLVVNYLPLLYIGLLGNLCFYLSERIIQLKLIFQAGPPGHSDFIN